MKELRFPLLTKDDIELRIGQMNKAGDKATLLLYKTSRTDADILDRVVGAGNWQKRFYTLQGVGIGDNMRSIVVCSVGIYDDDKKEWIWKDDSGTESNVEQDKGVCSDAFKRASGGSCWGIGRELYTAPTIWVKVESKYDKFKVASISYNENREIKTLEIANEKGEIVYQYGLGKKVSQTTEKAPQKRDIIKEVSKGIGDSFIANDDDVMCCAETKSKIQEITGKLSADRYANFKNYLKGTFNVDSIAELTEKQGQQLLKALRGGK